MIRGAHVMQGYWNDPEMTAARLRPGRWPWERVLASGDLFRSDDEGYLYFVGRRDDLIKSGGEKVVPREIEDVLHSAPGVREAAVIGIPDRLLGQAVHAHVSRAARRGARRGRSSHLLRRAPRGLQGAAASLRPRSAPADEQRQDRSAGSWSDRPNLIETLAPRSSTVSRLRRSSRPIFGLSIQYVSLVLETLMSNAEVTSVTAERYIEPLATEWDALADSSKAPPFLRPGWVAAWWRAFGKGTLEILTARRRGCVVGVLPLYRRRGGSDRRVTGTHPVRHYHRPLGRQAGTRAIARLARRTTREPGSRRTLTDRTLIRAVGRRDGTQSSARQNARAVSICPDRPGLGNVPSELSNNLRSALIRGRRGLRNGSVVLEVADGSERLYQLLAEGFRLEASRWRGIGEDGDRVPPGNSSLLHRRGPLGSTARLASTRLSPELMAALSPSTTPWRRAALTTSSRAATIRPSGEPRRGTSSST